MSSVEARIRQWLGIWRGDRHPLLAGEAAAEPVLRELADDPSDPVRVFADVGLRRLAEKREAKRLGG